MPTTSMSLTIFLKKCSRCGVDKLRIAFRKRSDSPDGLRGVCKACKKESDRAYYLENKTEIAIASKEYRSGRKDEIRKYQKEYYKENKGYVSERQKRWAKNNRELITEHMRKYRKDNPLKIQARSALGHAVRDGLISREPCEVCGSYESEGHHHNGYEEEHWLDVQWLCKQHHAETEASNG